MLPQLHAVEIMRLYQNASRITFQIYLDEEARPQLYLPLPGWQGAVAIGGEGPAACRPFLMDESGSIDFGGAYDEPERFGAIHWGRLEQIRCGAEVLRWRSRSTMRRSSTR